MQFNHTIDEYQATDMINDALIAGLNTIQPGYIEDYNPDKLTASVRPVFTDTYLLDDGQREKLDYPIIPNVPVASPSLGGGWYDYTPFEKGDPVLLLCSQRSLEEWAASNGKTQVAPKDLRMMDASDFIILGGLRPQGHKAGDADPKDRVIGHKDGKMLLTLKADGTFTATCSRMNIGSKSASTPLAKGNTTNDNLTTLKDKINEIITVATAAGGLIIPPVLPIVSIPSVASAKVFTND